MEKGACLLLHGFTGGPYEVEPLAHHLRENGWDCYTPTLSGHGGDLRNLKPVHRSEWVRDAEAQAVRLEERFGSFDLVGFSMSGLIAAYLANRFPVRRLVLLNTAVFYFSPARLVKDLMEHMQMKDMSYYRIKERTPISAVLQFMRLVTEMKPEINKVAVPTLIVQGERDQVVHPKSAQYIFRNVRGDREMALFRQSRHLICLDVESKELFRRVERFFNR